MSVKPIRTRAEQRRALAEIERLMGAKRGTAQANRLEVLAALVGVYEAAHDPIDLPEPIDAIEAHMAERDLVQANLARLLGSRSLASAILNRRRAMFLSVIRKLAKAWDIPADILVQPYRLHADRPRASSLIRTPERSARKRVETNASRTNMGVLATGLARATTRRCRHKTLGEIGE